jgi:phosphopantothenoylcysteine synthetase/decarboxylase
MNLLVTAGNTLILIDRVRAITNIFTGRTGAQIALHAHERGHTVTLLTSHPEVVPELHDGPALSGECWTTRPYRTFDDLRREMEQAIRPGRLDAIIHCAAVSDYQSAGIYAPAEQTRFVPATGRWEADGPPRLEDRSAGKVKSDEPELWLRLVRTPKLVDLIRSEWGFSGILVKFKLEVGVSEERLLQIAERSRAQSSAELMVANTLEDSARWAYLGPLADGYQRLTRRDLSARLLDEVERLHRERGHG